MQLLRQGATLLLDLPLRISNLQFLYGRQPLGLDLQRDPLAMP